MIQETRVGERVPGQRGVPDFIYEQCIIHLSVRNEVYLSVLNFLKVPCLH